jgi:hypothetical protein
MAKIKTSIELEGEFYRLFQLSISLVTFYISDFNINFNFFIHLLIVFLFRLTIFYKRELVKKD